MHFNVVLLPPLVNAMLLLLALAQSVIAATAFAPVLLASHVLSAVKTLH